MTGSALGLTAAAKPETCTQPYYQGTQPYATGSVTTDGTFSFTYGYVEARVWLPSGPGGVADWPAFWADGQAFSAAGGEIDIVEGLHGDTCATFHDDTGAGTTTCPAGTFAGGWHTFAADWEPGSVTFYYDGSVVAKTDSGVTSLPMFLVLDLALSSGVTSPDLVPATMQVAYVRVWQR